jgi:hypothetical protein
MFIFSISIKAGVKPKRAKTFTYSPSERLKDLMKTTAEDRKNWINDLKKNHLSDTDNPDQSSVKS